MVGRSGRLARGFVILREILCVEDIRRVIDELLDKPMPDPGEAMELEEG